MTHDKFPAVDLTGLDPKESTELLTSAAYLLECHMYTFLCSALCVAGGGAYGDGKATDAAKVLVERIEKSIDNRYRAKMVHLADWYMKTYNKSDVEYMDCELVKFRIDFANYLIRKLKHVAVVS